MPQKFNVYITKDDIKNSPFSLGQVVSPESPTCNLTDFKFPNPVDSLTVPSDVQEGSLVSIFDPSSCRLLYNLVSKSKDILKTSYSSLEKCLNNLRHHVADYNITKLALPQLECQEGGLHWPKVCQLILKIFKKTILDLYIYVSTS